MRFSIDVGKFVKKTKLNASRVIVGTVIEVNSSVVVGTRVDTGRARGSWQASNGYPSQVVTDENQLDKSGNVTIQTANLVALNAPGNIYYVTSNIPYISKLEVLDLMVEKTVQNYRRLVGQQLAKLK